MFRVDKTGTVEKRAFILGILSSEAKAAACPLHIDMKGEK
jgi:hypothetical protein